VVSIRGKQIGGKYLSLPNPHGTARLYGVDGIRGEKTVLVAAGEFDAAVLQQMGYATIGVPGENIWKAEWTEELADAKRVFILFDNDNAGKAGAEKLATKLGPTSRVVEMPEARPGQKKIDVSEWYVNHSKTREDFDYLLSKATGGLLVSPTQAYDRWTEIEGNPDLVGLRFNVNGIDKEMQHGLLPGQVVVVISKSNAGKTLATLNIFHRMKMFRPDIKVLYISLEQTRNEWFERAHRINNFYNPNSTTLDTVKYWQDSLYLVDKNRLTEEELEVCLDQYEFETGRLPDIVAVDYLGYYSRSFSGEEYARVTSAIMGLKGIAKTRQIVIFAPHQVNRTGDYGKAIQADQGKSSGAIEETADMLISLWNPDQQLDTRKEDQKKEINMQILKSRDGGVGTLVQYQFAPLTLAIVPKDDPEYFERAMRERQYWLAGVDWKRAVYMHATGDERLDTNGNS
jgi:5S rRNA maturation endonuclease (ribonuclease M5)/archaellum biogenesis ATPase FlaH